MFYRKLTQESHGPGCIGPRSICRIAEEDRYLLTGRVERGLAQSGHRDDRNKEQDDAGEPGPACGSGQGDPRIWLRHGLSVARPPRPCERNGEYAAGPSIFRSIRAPARLVRLADDRPGVCHRTHVPELVGVDH